MPADVGVGRDPVPSEVADLDLVAAFLARRDLDALTPATGPFDVVVLLGSALLAPVRTAAEVVRLGLAPLLLVCGATGHSTPLLWRTVEADPLLRDVRTEGRPEAAVLRDVLVGHLGVPSDAVVVEAGSTDCGSNAVEARRVLSGSAPEALSPAGRVLLLQDPTMQRRSHACFVRTWGSEAPLTSFAPFVPRVGAVGGTVEGAWSYGRFVSLVLGEVRRLRDDEHGYGPRGAGFIDHVEVPHDVLLAAGRLGARYPDLVR